MAEPNEERPGEQAGATEELGTLFPDRTLTVAGEEVTVRALRFREGLDLLPVLRPILDDMQGVLEEAAGDPEAITAGRILELLERSPDAWTALAAAATGRDAAWVEGLPLEDGEALVLTAWRANAPFLLRRLVLGRTAATGAGSDTPSSSTS
ncbi:MAG: DUF6631 family protein [Thiohalorhabdus sp.]|uniref:DUF6631 family protein n=1 Tax=Thiohalorhabdus sp. TaxID=3094134 RepID=UPI003980545B